MEACALLADLYRLKISMKGFRTAMRTEAQQLRAVVEETLH